MRGDRSSTLPVLIIGVFTAVAILMAVLAAGSTLGAARALAREITAPGSVVDFAIRQAADGTLYYRPVVTFPASDGSRRTLTLAEESSDPAYAVDQHLPFMLE